MIRLAQSITLLLILTITSAHTSPLVTIELNKVEQRDQHCRFYLMAENKLGHAIDTLKMELVLFDHDGIIKKNMALDLAPLPVAKKSVKAFQLKNTTCSDVSTLLVNRIMHCETPAGTLTECLQKLSLSSKTDIQFMQ